MLSARKKNQTKQKTEISNANQKGTGWEIGIRTGSGIWERVWG